MQTLRIRTRMPWQRRRRFHRFSWIVSYLVIFLVPLRWHPPDDMWKIFSWYVGSFLLFDTFFTVYDINATSLFAVKFRNPEERRAVQGLGTLLGIPGLVLAFVITGMIVNQNHPESNRQGALVSFGGGFLYFALLLPGVYETMRLRAEYARNQALAGDAAQPFFAVARKVLSNRLISASSRSSSPRSSCAGGTSDSRWTIPCAWTVTTTRPARPSPSTEHALPCRCRSSSTTVRGERSSTTLPTMRS